MDITKSVYPRVKGHFYMCVDEDSKTATLLRILNGVKFDQFVILFNSVSHCEAVSNVLTENNIQAVIVHDKLSPEERLTRYEQFKTLKPRILVATNLVNFCLHTTGTNLIINYDMPAIINNKLPLKFNFDMPFTSLFDHSAPHFEYMYRVLCIGPFCDKSLSITFVQTVKDIRQVYGSGIHGTNICELSTDVDPKLYSVLAANPIVPLQYYVDLAEDEKLQCMLVLLDSFDLNKAIIFVNSDDACKPVKEFLNNVGFRAVSFRGNMTEEERQSNYTSSQEDCAIIVTTNLGECGLRLKGFGIVINYDMPKTTDEYFNRVVCAGNFNGKGLVVSFAIDQEEDNFLDEVEERLNVTIPYLPKEVEISDSVLNGKYDDVTKKPFWYCEPETAPTEDQMNVVENT